MKKLIYTLPLVLLLNLPININAQTDADEMGAWYMYISAPKKRQSLGISRRYYIETLTPVVIYNSYSSAAVLPIYPKKVP